MAATPPALAIWADVTKQLGLTVVALYTVDLQVVGDQAYEIGRAKLTLDNGEDTGRYVVVWKEEGGRWRWDVDIWNIDAA